MQGPYFDVPISVQVGLLALIPILTLAAEWKSKRSHWGFVAWAGCIALAVVFGRAFFSPILQYLAGSFSVLSFALLVDAYSRSRRMRQLK